MGTVERDNMAGHDAASVKGNDKAKRMMVSVKVQVQTLVVRLQKTLLEASVTPKELNRAMQYFVPHNLTDVVEERASSGLCGWPLCSAAISTKTKRTGRYRISLADKKVYDQRELQQYCGRRCYGVARVCCEKISQSPIENRECTQKLLAMQRKLEKEAAERAGESAETVPTACSEPMARPTTKSKAHAHDRPTGRIPEVDQLAGEAMKLKIVERDSTNTASLDQRLIDQAEMIGKLAMPSTGQEDVQPVHRTGGLSPVQ